MYREREREREIIAQWRQEFRAFSTALKGGWGGD